MLAALGLLLGGPLSFAFASPETWEEAGDSITATAAKVLAFVLITFVVVVGGVWVLAKVGVIEILGGIVRDVLKLVGTGLTGLVKLLPVAL
jgi:hypothetical protein